MRCPRHCIPAGDLECFEMLCTVSFLSGVLGENQGEHTMQKVNKRQLSQNRPCPSLAILNRNGSETSRQVLPFTLGQTLLLSDWGWIFTSSQFLCWLSNLACCLLWESQWELLVGSFLSSPFSEDTYSCPCFTGRCCQLCSLSQFKHPQPRPVPEPVGFCFCCPSWECTLSLTPLVSPTWKWSSTQSPAHSGVPKHAGLLRVNQKRSWCACELRRGE